MTHLSTETRHSDWAATRYSDPRMACEFPDWPLGGSRRGRAQYSIETHPVHGQRAVRTTIGKPKRTTYAALVRIVEGDDGRTYIAELREHAITILRGDMKIGHEYIAKTDPRYAAVAAMLRGRG